ncbi:hypothetical protein C1886_26035, partial [Pseudomonas sp. FW300-N1A1]
TGFRAAMQPSVSKLTRHGAAFTSGLTACVEIAAECKTARGCLTHALWRASLLALGCEAPPDRTIAGIQIEPGDWF